MQRKPVQDDDLDFEDLEADELCEASYTSDLEDDDPSAFVCDLPEDEAAEYRKKLK
ncbi:MAG: hypothetical protein K6G15_07510 [Desulfovibrio sp.]|nr:hypothetical protein [Desulfovibrio sp.]